MAGPQSVSDLFDAAFRLFRRHFTALALTVALVYVPLAVVSALVNGPAVAGALGMVGQLFGGTLDPARLPDQEMTAARMALTYALTLAGGGAALVAGLALYVQAAALARGERRDARQALRAGLRSFWAYLFMALLRGLAIWMLFGMMTFAMFLGFAVVAIPIGLLAGPLEGTALGEVVAGGAVVLALLGFLAGALATVGPPALLFARWSAAGPLIVDRGLGPIAALKESWRLTRRMNRRSLGFVLVLGGFNIVIYWGLYALVAAIGGVSLEYISATAAATLYASLSAVLPIIWEPLAVLALTLFYFDLRVRSDSYDLEQRISQWEDEQDNAAQPAV